MTSEHVTVVNALGMHARAAACGSIITISADGGDETEAVRALVDLVASGFGEDGCNV